MGLAVEIAGQIARRAQLGNGRCHVKIHDGDHLPWIDLDVALKNSVEEERAV